MRLLLRLSFESTSTSNKIMVQIFYFYLDYGSTLFLISDVFGYLTYQGSSNKVSPTQI